MNTIYFPETGQEVFAMLPDGTKAEYGITEGSHWTRTDACRELGNLALSALRCCRVNVRKGMLVRTDDSVCVHMHKTHEYKHMPSIDALQCYMNEEDAFEWLGEGWNGVGFSLHCP